MTKEGFLEETGQEGQVLTACVRSQSLSRVRLFRPVDCSLPGSLSMRILQARILEWVAMPSSRDLLDPGIEPMSLVSLALQADSLPLSHQRSPVLTAGLEYPDEESRP